MITLKSLSVTGSSVEVARVGFGEKLTVIHGASDTGKSYVLDLLDFILGGKTMRHIDEARDYVEVELAWITADGQEVTFRRRLDDKKIWMKKGDGTEAPLKIQHSSLSEDNVSRVMLMSAGMDGWVAISNQNGDTANVSFRDILHLTMGSEEKLFSKAAPFSTGNFPASTKEKSIVRCVLTGESDPAQVPGARKQEKADSKKQRDMLDRLLGHLLKELEGKPGAAEAKRMAHALSESIASLESARVPLHARLQEKISEGMAAHQEIETRRLRLSEMGESLERFALLQRQYISDLDRLDVLDEGYIALGLDEPTKCPLCLQELSNDDHLHAGSASVPSAIQAERDRILLLLAGLVSTIESLSGNVFSLEAELESLQADGERIASSIAELEAKLEPTLAELEGMRSKLAAVQSVAAKHEQLASIEEFRANIRIVDGQRVPALQMSPYALSGYSQALIDVLSAWGVEGAHTAYIASDNFEPVVAGKRRSDRGKGYRALLYAAQVVSLAQYCLQSDLPHPGFIVLDSPLVTYKSPKRRAEDTDIIPDSVVAKFFEYLNTSFLGQAVVLENVSPEVPVEHSEEFTGSGNGRAGFYPLS